MDFLARGAHDAKVSCPRHALDDRVDQEAMRCWVVRHKKQPQRLEGLEIVVVLAAHFVIGKAVGNGAVLAVGLPEDTRGPVNALVAFLYDLQIGLHDCASP